MLFIMEGVAISLFASQMLAADYKQLIFMFTCHWGILYSLDATFLNSQVTVTLKVHITNIEGTDFAILQVICDYFILEIF